MKSARMSSGASAMRSCNASVPPRLVVASHPFTLSTPRRDAPAHAATAPDDGAGVAHGDCMGRSHARYRCSDARGCCRRLGRRDYGSGMDRPPHPAPVCDVDQGGPFRRAAPSPRASGGLGGGSEAGYRRQGRALRVASARLASFFLLPKLTASSRKIPTIVGYEALPISHLHRIDSKESKGTASSD